MGGFRPYIDVNTLIYHRLVEVDKATRSGKWGYPLDGANVFELAGKKAGLLGLGNIGKQVARRLLAFEAQVQYYDLLRLPSADEDALSINYVDLETLFSTSDIISIQVPLVDSSYHLVVFFSPSLLRRWPSK